VPTLAELLLAHGWRTAAFSCNPFLGPGSGLERGFERYAGYQYNAKAGVDRALEWLGDHKGERFFLFLHLIDPHYPYAPPDPFAKRFAVEALHESALADAPPPLDDLRREASDDVRRALVDLYDGEIAFADAQLARLLARVRELGIEGSTLVVLHADHGEELWDHGGFEHGHTQHEELLHVPLVLSLPGRVPAEKRVAQRVRAQDAFATILELCGVARPASTSSESLLAPIERDRDALSESILWGTREEKSLAIGRDKLISDGAGGESLFDLDVDPLEQIDRASAAPDVAAKLRDALRVQHAGCATAAPSASTLRIDEATRSRLDRLGYAGGDDERK
jgi:arylsulfatase A-like enzyme